MSFGIDKRIFTRQGRLIQIAHAAVIFAQQHHFAGHAHLLEQFEPSRALGS
jgi:hypothetical protein